MCAVRGQIIQCSRYMQVMEIVIFSYFYYTPGRVCLVSAQVNLLTTFVRWLEKMRSYTAQESVELIEVYNENNVGRILYLKRN